MAVRALAGERGQNGQWATLKIDFENAVNKVSREAFLEEVSSERPGLAKWVYWCYGQPAHLWAGDTSLSSSQGVQQGDPLGPLLFAQVLRKVTRRLRELHPDLALSGWYLDDGVLVGARSTSVAVLTELSGSDAQALEVAFG